MAITVQVYLHLILLVKSKTPLTMTWLTGGRIIEVSHNVALKYRLFDWLV